MTPTDFTKRVSAEADVDAEQRVIRLRPATKKPINSGWQHGEGDASETFLEGENLGGLNRTSSGRWIDVD